MSPLMDCPMCGARFIDDSTDRLEGERLNWANLTGVNLTDATLTNATLTGANLSGVTWSYTICPDGTVTSTGCPT